MTGVLRIILICCLIQGIKCQKFSLSLKSQIEVLSGSCGVVPCTFTVEEDYEDALDASCKIMWRLGRTVMFDSSKSNNFLTGRLVGRLEEKNCTTIFYNIRPVHNSKYNMRIECDDLAYNFGPKVAIDVEDSLPNPSIIHPTLAVGEGAELQLSCSAPTPCPVSPPHLSWSPVLGETSHVAPDLVMNFNASYLHNGLQITCAARYPRQQGFFRSQSSVAITVFFSPRQPNITFTGPVIEGRQVTLTCNTQANPAPEFLWYQEVGHDLVPVGFWQRLSITANEDSKRFLCMVKNLYGNSSSFAAIDVQFPPKDMAVTVDRIGPIVEGEPVVLFCNSRGNPPVTNYTWVKDDVEIAEHQMNFSIDSVELRHSGHYKCEAMNDVGRSTSLALLLDVQYAPKNTTVSNDPPGPVSDGTPVTLTCASQANPGQVNFTWYRVGTSGEQAVGSGEQFTFKAAKLSQDQYFCRAVNIHGTKDSEVTQTDVPFAAEILPSSRCVQTQTGHRCHCDSQGNPPPNIRWELPPDSFDNQTLESSDDKMFLGSFTRRSCITLSVLNEEKPHVVCVSMNTLGSDTLVLNISLSDSLQGLNSVAVLAGISVGALSVVLLCVPLLYFIFRKGSPSSNTKLVNASETRDSNKRTSVISTIYANKDMMEKAEQAEEQLHYARVDFSRLRLHSNGDQDEGQIRGLSSKTAEYAEIRLYSREVGPDETTATDDDQR